MKWLLVILVLAMGAEARAQDLGVGGARGSAIIRRIVHRHRSALTACYAERLRARPELEGRWTVHFVVSPDGRVVDARVVPTGVEDRPLSECTERVLFRMTFPSLGPGEIRVTWTFDYVRTSPEPSTDPPVVRRDDRGPYVIRRE